MGKLTKWHGEPLDQILRRRSVYYFARSRFLPGTYLKQGTTFAEVEDTRTVRTQIAAPVSDIGKSKSERKSA